MVTKMLFVALIYHFVEIFLIRLEDNSIEYVFCFVITNHLQMFIGRLEDVKYLC